MSRERTVRSHLVKQPGGEDNLEQIVAYQGVLELEGFSVLHQLRSEHLDAVDVREADEQRGKRRAHQQPIGRPGVYKETSM